MSIRILTKTEVLDLWNEWGQSGSRVKFGRYVAATCYPDYRWKHLESRGNGRAKRYLLRLADRRQFTYNQIPQENFSCLRSLA